MTTVSQVILDALPRLNAGKPTGTTVYQAINLVNSMLLKRLMNRRSDLAKSGDMTITLTSSSNAYTLPGDFMSLAELPFISDVTTGCRVHPIEPLDVHRSHFTGRTSNRPHRYEVIGSQIYFYPALDPTDDPAVTPGAIAPTVEARYYTAPSVASAPTDTIPFNGMFDQAYFQGVPRIIIKGLATIQADPDFAAFIDNEVDMVLNTRIQPLPERRMRRSSWL